MRLARHSSEQPVASETAALDCAVALTVKAGGCVCVRVTRRPLLCVLGAYAAPQDAGSTIELRD